MPPRRESTPRSPEHGALGEAVRRLREAEGWTQEKLAEEAETDLRQIGGIERGLRNPTYLFLLRLAKADPKIAAGPIVLAMTDLAALLFYFTIAGQALAV